MKREGDDGEIYTWLIVAIVVFVLGWITYSQAFDKCKKAGKSPGFCYDYLR